MNGWHKQAQGLRVLLGVIGFLYDVLEGRSRLVQIDARFINGTLQEQHPTDQ